MDSKKSHFMVIGFALLCLSGWSATTHSERSDDENLVLALDNDHLSMQVTLRDGLLAGERLALTADFAHSRHGSPLILNTDGGFLLDLYWTDWRFPGNDNNGDNRVSLDQSRFRYSSHQWKDGQWEIVLAGINHPLEVVLAYRLGDDDFFVRRRVTVRDKKHGGHFLESVHGYHARLTAHPAMDEEQADLSIKIEGSDSYADLSRGKGDQSGPRPTIIKAGSFGQPAALTLGNGGAFFGLEYPASANRLTEDRTLFLDCSQEIGERVGREAVATEWVVLGLTPNSHVKDWFFEYLDRIRVAPLKPYTLYNSWYDLRSVEYPKVLEAHHMSRENVMRMVSKVRENMIEKHGIKMDAFVLDDGWDIYDSDWKLRDKQFPRGMKPIADSLAETDTDLGIWFGPTGGYSFKMRRLEWMKANGYEVIHDYDMTYRHSMLCLAGQNYRKTFKDRVTAFVKNDDVGFFKWDGIQFACSDSSHGHPLGRYSRRATLETLIDICNAVRAENPDIFLNITSGTWLSPWWVKYTNQIWMDGQDYAFANVPSISKRDNAITYRDFVLYDDFHNKDLWFPIANLMTHGIIKGKLDHIGGTDEPIDKYTDNALLYFARGVSMWELYISPDILTDAEWDATSQAITWARDRFPLMHKTYMVGGDPMRRQAYGYVHYKNARGIVAVRNPYVEKQEMRIVLDPAHGLDANAANLVVERVYPTRRIETRLFAAGGALTVKLDGYQTAVYEIYPLEEAERPLLAGAVFEDRLEGSDYGLTVYQVDEDARLLNPEKVRGINGKPVSPDSLNFVMPAPAAATRKAATVKSSENKRLIKQNFQAPRDARNINLALLIQDDRDEFPSMTVTVNGESVEASIQKQKGKWIWYSIPCTAGDNKVELELSRGGEGAWPGQGELWLSYVAAREGQPLQFQTVKPVTLQPQPPKPWKPGETRLQHKLGVVDLSGDDAIR